MFFMNEKLINEQAYNLMIQFFSKNKKIRYNLIKMRDCRRFIEKPENVFWKIFPFQVGLVEWKNIVLSAKTTENRKMWFLLKPLGNG